MNALTGYGSSSDDSDTDAPAAPAPAAATPTADDIVPTELMKDRDRSTVSRSIYLSYTVRSIGPSREVGRNHSAPS